MKAIPRPWYRRPALGWLCSLFLTVAILVGATGDGSAMANAASVSGGYVVSDTTVDPNQGGRHGASFADGQFRRRIEVRPGNQLLFLTTEGQVLYTEDAAPQNMIINDISTETSSFSGTVILYLFGFTPDTGNSRAVVLVTNYRVQPRIDYTGAQVAVPRIDGDCSALVALACWGVNGEFR